MRGDVRIVTPRLNHGRWIIDCPDDATHAIIADLADRGVFVCPVCGNAETGRGLARVHRDVLLEAEVLRRVAHRPEVNQNWTTGEPLANLEVENRAHGYPSESGGLVVAPDGGGLEKRL